MTRGLFGWRARAPRRRVLVLIDLIQDIEVLLPLLRRLAAEPEMELDIRVSTWLKRESPRTARLLQASHLTFRWIGRREVIGGAAPDLRGRQVLVTASESSHPAHAAGHALARRANARGLLTCTLQHGLENVGLLGDPRAVFASQVVFTWHPPALTGSLPAPTRAKLAHVGRVWAPPDPAPPATHDIGVFENLHGDRYGEADRAGFLAGLEALAASGASVLLRAHPAGRWSAGLASLPPAIERATDAAVSETLARVRRVITTPSTVVLDAAQMRRPVALATQGSALFSPFPVLHDPGAWADFAGRGDDAVLEREAFLACVLMPGDAAGRIASFLGRGRPGENL